MLGQIIKQKREAMGLSCSALARSAEHSVSSVHNIESGASRSPKFDILCDISDVLGISLDELKKAYNAKRKRGKQWNGGS